MRCAEVKGRLFADCQEWRFKAANGLIRAVLSCKRVICWCPRIAFSGCEKFRYEHCNPPSRSICLCSGIEFWGCEKLKYGMCCSAISLVYWFWGIAYSGWEKFRNGQCRPTKMVNLLILRNRVFRLRNVDIWAVVSNYEVDLLMLRNRVIRLRKGQIWAKPT